MSFVDSTETLAPKTARGERLATAKTTKTGVTINICERAGEIRYGSMDFEEPTEAEIERRRRLTG